MVMAQPMLAILKKQGSQIDVLALSWIAPLLLRMPGVDGVVDMPIGHGQLVLGQRYGLGCSLRGKYDQAVVLPNTLKSALIPLFAKIPIRTGYLGETRYGLLNDIRVLDKAAMPRQVQRYTALALAKQAEPVDGINSPELAVTDRQLEQTLDDLEIQRPASRLIGLCPGAEYGPAKRWPVGHYAELAKAFLEKGFAVWFFGSARDSEITQSINRLCDSQCMDLAGKTTLDQTIDLMSLADTVVTNDSGLMHIACALGRKVVALYGSTSPDFTPPLSDQAVVVRREMDCSPCFKRECPLGHTHCLTEITAEQVFSTVVG